MKNTIILALVFGLIGTTFADFTCSVKVAEGEVGASRTATATYAGGGLGSPLVRVEAGDGAYVRFSEADGWAKSVEFLALGGDGTQDFFCLADNKDAKLELSYTVGSSEAIPWTTLGASLKPSYVSEDAWAYAEQELESRLGATWNTYLARLKANADYLADLGYVTKRTDCLLALEINRALGVNAVVPTLVSAADISRSARGLPLAFSRSFSSAMYAHFNCGALGYGWTDNYSLYAELVDETTLAIRLPSGGSYSFSKVTGTWQPEDARDVTKLMETSDVYVLTYENGMVQTFAKSNMRLKTIADNVGNTLTFAYNGGRGATALPTQVTHSDGQKLTFAYNVDGLLTSVTDDIGNQVSYTYDADRQLKSVTGTDGLVTAYEYQSENDIIARALRRITYPDKTTLDFMYVTTGTHLALDSITPSACGTTSFYYPDVGTIQITLPDGGVTEVSMGPSGEVLKATDALGNVVTRTYDGDGLLKMILAPSGKSGQYAYDARGRVTAQTSSAGNKTTFDYTELFGNLKTLKDAKNQSVTYGYDDKGRATSVTFPDGAKMLVAYNEKGDVAKTTNCRGQSETYGYDAEGRVTSRTWANGRTFTYAYDAKGRLITATDSESGKVSMAYDDGDRLTKIVYPNSKGFTFTYDAAGRLTKRAALDGTAECYAYDSAGRVSEVTDGNGGLYLHNTYEMTTGQLIEQAYGNGTSTEYAYDLCGRITSIVHKDASGKITESLQYCYDEDGRCIRAASLLGEERYTYDDDGQLTGVTYPVGENETFAYDAAGNRTSANGATYTVNNLNQYSAVVDATPSSRQSESTNTSFTYDADGNLTSKTDANGTTTYTYDQQNRLIAVSNPTTKLDWSCTYDVLGNRVSVTTNGVTTTRVMLPGALPSVAAEYQNGTLVKRHIVVGATQIADIDAAGHSNYYHGDLIGSTRLITDQTGATVNRLSYKAFGEVRSSVDATPSSRQSPTAGYVGTLGVETDPTGLLFMRNRYYDPQLGRFIQRDPIGLSGGDANWYRYCGNKPVGRNDPNGLWTSEDTWQAIKIGGGVLLIVGGLFGAQPELIYIGGATLLAGDTAHLAASEYVSNKYGDRSVEDSKVGYALGAFGTGIGAYAKVLETVVPADEVSELYNQIARIGLDEIGNGVSALGVIDAIDYFIPKQDMGDVLFDETESADDTGGEDIGGGDSGGGDTGGGDTGGGDSGGDSGGGGTGGGDTDGGDTGGGSTGGGSIMNEADWLKIATNVIPVTRTDAWGKVHTISNIIVAKTATFSLGADITLTNPKCVVHDFSGVLAGNGHRITLGGTLGDGGLFPSIHEATITGFVYTYPRIATTYTKCRFENCQADYTGSAAGGSYGILAENCIFQNCNAEVNIEASGSSYHGGFFGSVSGGSFIDCWTKGRIRGFEDIGGLVGSADESTSFVYCSASCTLSGDDSRVGGLVGSAEEGVSFQNCQSSCTVTSNGSRIGGLVGNAEGCSFASCSSTGIVSGFNDVGGVVGESKGVIFDQCWSSATVSGRLDIGGFVGLNNKVAGTYSNCKTKGDVSGGSCVGGFVGKTVAGNFSQCSSSGKVSFDSAYGTSGNFGGFIGQNGSSGNCSRCQSSSEVSATGQENVGGFAGSISGGTMDKCQASGNVLGGNAVGGFAGAIGAGTVTDCGATGAVTSDGCALSAGGYTTEQANAGGFVGSTMATANMRCCYAGGLVKSTKTASLDMQRMVYVLVSLGGFSPTSCMYGSVENCYWNPNTTKQNASGLGTSATSGYTGLDFSSTWKMANGHPQLQNIGSTLKEETQTVQSVRATSFSAQAKTFTASPLATLALSDSESDSSSLPIFDSYVLVANYNYSFLVALDGGAAVSVSGLPAGLVFADGCVTGKVETTGTSIVTITAGGETKTVTFEVIDAPTGFATQYRSAGGVVPEEEDPGDDPGEDPGGDEPEPTHSVTLALSPGWNWISLNVVPTDASIGAVFADVPFADEDVIKSTEGPATYYGGKWYGELTTIKPGIAYMVKMSAAGSQTLTVTGSAAATSVEVVSGWNWIGPTAAAEVSLDALTHSGGFTDEDVIKSADAFATYASGKWYGELKSLKPGVGYKAKFAKGGTLAFSK